MNGARTTTRTTTRTTIGLFLIIYSIAVKGLEVSQAFQTNLWSLNMQAHMVSGQPSSYFPVPVIRDTLLPVPSLDIPDESAFVRETIRQQWHDRAELLLRQARLRQTSLWSDPLPLEPEKNSEEEEEPEPELQLAHTPMLFRNEADLDATLAVCVRNSNTVPSSDWQEYSDFNELAEVFLKQFLMLDILWNSHCSSEFGSDVDTWGYTPSDAPDPLKLPSCQSLVFLVSTSVFKRGISRVCIGATDNPTNDSNYLCTQLTFDGNTPTPFCMVWPIPITDTLQDQCCDKLALSVLSTAGIGPNGFPSNVTVTAHQKAEKPEKITGLLATAKEIYIFNRDTKQILSYQRTSIDDGVFSYQWADETDFEGLSTNVKFQIKELVEEMVTKDHLIERQASQIERQASQIAELQEQMQAMMHKVETLAYSVNQSSKGHSGFRHHTNTDVMERLATLEQLAEILKQQDNKQDEEVGTLHQYLEQQNQALVKIGAKVNELDLKVDVLAVRSTDGILIWKVDEVERRIEEARKGKITSLYSPPFFTSLHGYRMCLRLYLNGDGQGQGSHVSLFLVILRSDYDDLLTWPFQQKVTLYLINQKDPYTTKEQIAQAFRPTKESSSFQKPRGPYNTASGFPKFFPIDKLRDSRFVVDDCMYFKVKIDRSDLKAPDYPVY